MDQLNNFADKRLVTGCIYCGGAAETRDHAPSRVFLDVSYPTNLPVVPACFNCNNGFSLDEEYVACLIEVALSGTADPEKISRPNIASKLKQNIKLRAQIESAIRSSNTGNNLDFDSSRIDNVVTKLARAHCAYELSTLCVERPSTIEWHLIEQMSAEERECYEEPFFSDLLGEIGSRGMQRLYVAEVTYRDILSDDIIKSHLIVNDWVEVQEGQYRYIAHHEPSAVTVKIVISEFLACYVSWDT